MYRLIFYFLICIPSISCAQSLSIQDVWDKIYSQRILEEENLKIELKRKDLQSLEHERLPLFYLDANLQRNLVIPITPVPAVAFNPDARDGEIIPLRFATKWSSKAGGKLEWKILDFTRKSKAAENELYLKQAKINKEQRMHDWKKDAVLAYASVVLASKQYETSRQDSAQYAEIVNIVRDRHLAGRAYSNELITAQQELERKKIQLYEAWSVLKEMSLELQSQMDVSAYQNLSSDIPVIQQYLAANIDTTNYEQQLLILDKQVAEAQFEQIRAKRLPSLSFNAYYGQQFFNNDLDIFQNQYWFGNSFANVALRIPISDYIWKNPSLEKARIQSRLSEVQLNHQRIDDATAFSKKQHKILAAKLKAASLEKIEALAAKSQQEQLAAYEAGRLLLTDYNATLVALNKAKQDLWQAQYDWIKIMLE